MTALACFHHLPWAVKIPMLCVLGLCLIGCVKTIVELNGILKGRGR